MARWMSNWVQRRTAMRHHLYIKPRGWINKGVKDIRIYVTIAYHKILSIAIHNYVSLALHIYLLSYLHRDVYRGSNLKYIIMQYMFVCIYISS